MNKTSHFFIAVSFAMGVACSVAAGPVDSVVRVAAASNAQLDFTFSNSSKTVYDSSFRGAEATPAKSPQAAVLLTVGPSLREFEQKPLPGPVTLLAGLALICGIAFRRLSA